MKKNAPFNPSPTAEREFIRALRKIARISGGIVEAHVNGAVLSNSAQMMRQLEEYSKLLTPWAIRQSSRMLEQVMRSNKRAYQNKSKKLGLALKLNVAEKDTGKAAAALMLEQVELIKSIPIEAGQRAQKLALEAFYEGTRADQIAKELLATTDVTESRAILIGRTETARANAAINKARAEALGSNQYRWHNSGDGAVRESHKRYQNRNLQGRIFSWDDPPTLDDGMTGHPGTFPNCFLGSSKITGSPFIQTFYRHLYTGKVVSLSFSDGSSLAATPNHPVFSTVGFKSIQSFNIGDQILSVKQKSPGIIKDNINSFYITFNQIFDAAMKSDIFVKTVVPHADFHGDRTNEKVDIIRPNSSLMLEIHARTIQKLFELDFTGSQVMVIQQFFAGNSSLRDCEMAFLDLSFSLIKSHLTPLELFCFALGPNISPGLDEMFSDDNSRNIEKFRDLIFAYTFLVHGFDFISVHLKRAIDRTNSLSDRGVYSPSAQMFADKMGINTDDFGNLNQSLSKKYEFLSVVDKSVINLVSHVYNLQTESGYYITENKATENCRCYAEGLFDEG